MQDKEFFITLFQAAVEAADPERTIAGHIPPKPKGRTIVIGAGKGSAQMASAFEKAWTRKYGDSPLEGLVVTRYGFGAPCKHIEIIEASHPVPDAAGLVASKRLLEIVSGLTKDDLVVALISGGGSALLPSPPEGMTLDDEITVNKVLLASGAPIAAMNAVRKHLSTIKGGRLAAAAHPARVYSLIVSDIPGDTPAFVASGPTVTDETTREDALKIVERYNLDLPAAALAHLQSENANAPKPSDAVFAGHEHRVIASAGVSLAAAAKAARNSGVEAVILSDAIEGEAREVAHVHAALAKHVLAKDQPFKKPVVILSGGETTVTVRGKGKGGRNSEFLLSLAIDIDGADGISAFAADTDGIDGSEDNAGAFADSTSIARLFAKGHDASTYLNRNDAWTAFNAIGDLFVPGPTGTNVNDLRAILIR
ncbi:glycerate kinase type-2 family protein [Phyllobacterium sp. LjRoot231]|uniref:glycerate kinase type-2 family protein n=1 Tax=Phyllobacterium sp. LjRoot231 TaxID=3342289 RepID=UPI003F4F7EDD